MATKKKKRVVSKETRSKISAAMKGKRNAAGKPCPVCNPKNINPECYTCGGKGTLGHVLTAQGLESLRRGQAKRRSKEAKRRAAEQ